jgi:hypothetical protein
LVFACCVWSSLDVARLQGAIQLPNRTLESCRPRHRFARHTLDAEDRKMVHEVMRNHPLVTAREALRNRAGQAYPTILEEGTNIFSQLSNFLANHQMIIIAWPRISGGWSR